MQNGEAMAVYLAVDAKPGDWILLYAGVGIKIIDEQEAALGMEILKSK
jgi:hydrogenase maturation factor